MSDNGKGRTTITAKAFEHAQQHFNDWRHSVAQTDNAQAKALVAELEQNDTMRQAVIREHARNMVAANGQGVKASDYTKIAQDHQTERTQNPAAYAEKHAPKSVVPETPNVKGPSAYSKVAEQIKKGEALSQEAYNGLSKTGKFRAAVSANFRKPGGIAMKVIRGGVALGAAGVAVKGGVKMLQGLHLISAGVNENGEQNVADTGTFFQGAAQAGIAIPVGMAALALGGKGKILQGFSL